MSNDFVKKKKKKIDREDVSPFLSVFLYCPAILFVCECACVWRLYLQLGPMGRGRSSLGLLLLLPFHSRFLGLNAEAKNKKTNKLQNKKREKNKTKKKENLPTVQFCVFCIDVRSHSLRLVF